MGCLSRGVSSGERWLPENAPQKQESRKRALEIIKQQFKESLDPTEHFLTVLSLPGALPIMEYMILDEFPGTYFHLVERDPYVFAQLEQIVEHESSDLKYQCNTTKGELRNFLSNPSNGFYFDVLILDLMGGWNREYCTMFEGMFANNFVSENSLIIFTFAPFSRFQSHIDQSTLPFRFKDLLKKFPMELVDSHIYNDTKTHLHTMKTVVFRVTTGVKSMPTINTQFELNNSLRKAGWKPAHEVVDIGFRAATHLVNRLKNQDVTHKIVNHPSRLGGSSIITLFPPNTHSLIRSTYGKIKRTKDTERLNLATRARELSSELANQETHAPQPTVLESVVLAAPVESSPASLDALQELKSHPELYKAVMLLKALKDLNIL